MRTTRERRRALLDRLNELEVVKAADLSDETGVTVRTIYRDIDRLRQAGAPILSGAGFGFLMRRPFHPPQPCTGETYDHQ